MKKALSLLLAACMMLALAACGAAASSTPASEPASSAAADSEPADTEVPTFHIGIIQLVQHEALDAATQGFMDTLEANPAFNVEFDLQNAQGDSNTCATIANGFVTNKYDLIMANATAALQACAAATPDIPVLGTSVTDYGEALMIEDFDGTVGTNVSGTNDYTPAEDQAAVIKELFPEAQKIGMLYCSGEPNSQFQVDGMTTALEAMGYTCTPYSFSDSNDIATVCQKAAEESDVLYVPTDNTAAANTEIINNICSGVVPIFAGEEGICRGCGVVTMSPSYYDLGVQTAEMAAKVLLGEADISTMPVEGPQKYVKSYNAANVAALGLTVPEGYTELAAEE